jgi:hypothetical protein
VFSYYGAKTNIAKLYPPPKYGEIIEPFAGSARYSLLYFDRYITLIDKYKVVVDIWKWLQQCSEKDILSMPRKLDRNKTFDDYGFIEPQRNFFSFIAGSGDAVPRNIPTKRKSIERPNHVNYNLQRVAKNLFKIKHWEIIHGDYCDTKNKECTWFIDPPYQYGGYCYKENEVDFNYLSDWCRSRNGQVIVCENTKADWLDFKPLIKQRGSLKSTTEAIWTNQESSYNIKQSKLF